jgi:murein L,D-transpeptidase YcbB/YkuD
MRWLVALLAVAAGAAPLAARAWSAADREAFAAVVAASAAEGLDPADYAGDPDQAAMKLAHDYLEGATPAAARRGWRFPRGTIDYAAWLDDVIARHAVTASFAALLPASPAYAGLREALRTCAGAACRAIALNLDRWRWLPRDFGRRFLWINVPAYRLDLIEDGRIVASHRIIIGKPATPTPAFTAVVTGITVNPWWYVPASIVAETGIAPRQKPGPRNALGQIKFEMPNRYAVYPHDTPARALFARARRALSHGCIRIERPDALASLLAGGAVGRGIASGRTRTLPLDRMLPAYIVYFTAEADAAMPGGVALHPDVYGQDAAR